MALEPEAAALYCKTLPLYNNDKLFSVFKPNTEYMVVDIGGGTFDITVNRVTPNGLEEMQMANGGNFGGSKVNSAFFELLSNIFGKDTMKKLQAKFPDDYLRIDMDFESKKKTIKLNDKGRDIYFDIPCSLKDISTDGKSEDDIINACHSPLYNGMIELDFRRSRMRIKRKILEKLFEIPYLKITQRLGKLLSKPELVNLQAILMVGGFADSPLLFEKVKTFVQSRNRNVQVLKPQNAVYAVSHGAVFYGHDPTIFSKRVCRYTYGVESYMPFEKDLDFSSKLVVGEDGLEYCKDRFSKHVTVGEQIQVGTYTLGQIYLPFRKDQETVSFPVYVSKERDPRYTYDKCSHLGSLSLDLSESPYEEREIEVSIKFGDTEIAEVRAREINTSREVKAELTFLG